MTKKYHSFWYWLVFPDILFGLTFSHTLFFAPILINFHSLLTDCSRQATFDGCMAADSNDATSCTWNATTSTCSFADQFDCSIFNNDSAKCANDPTSSIFCNYRFIASSTSSSSSSITSDSGNNSNNSFVSNKKGNCVHKSGWSEVQLGLLAGFGVMGGIFAPFLMLNLALWMGFPFTFAVCGALGLLSAVIFSIGIAEGQNFAMYVTSRVIASITAYAGTYLYAPVLAANNHHHSLKQHHHPSQESEKKDETENEPHNKNDDGNQESVLQPEILVTKQKYFVVDPHEKVLHVRMMGAFVSVFAVIQAIYLYFVSPDGYEAQISNAASSLKFTTYVDFRTKLQVYNIIQYLIGAGFIVFAMVLKYYHGLEEDIVEEDHEDEGKIINEIDDEQLKEGDEALDDIELVESQEVQQQQQQQQEPVAESVAVADAPPSSPSSSSPSTTTTTATIIDLNVADLLLAPPCSNCSKNALLMWSGGFLAPIVLQLSGQAAVLSFTPLIMADVIKNGLLSQLIVTAPMPVGSIFSLVVLGRYYSPLQIFIVGGFLGCIGSLCIGIGIFLPTTVTDGSYDDAGAGLSIFGLVFFSFVFMAGPGTLIFSAMIEIYDSVVLPPLSTSLSTAAADDLKKNKSDADGKIIIQDYNDSDDRNALTRMTPTVLRLLHKHQHELLGLGLSISGSWTGTLQFIFRFAFPVFVKNAYPDDVRVGRAIAFFGFTAITFLANVFLMITQRLRGRNVGAPKAVVKIVDGIVRPCS